MLSRTPSSAASGKPSQIPACALGRCWLTSVGVLSLPEGFPPRVFFGQDRLTYRRPLKAIVPPSPPSPKFSPLNECRTGEVQPRVLYSYYAGRSGDLPKPPGSSGYARCTTGPSALFAEKVTSLQISWLPASVCLFGSLPRGLADDRFITSACG